MTDRLRNPTHRALITGVTGQDGSYLAEYLLSLPQPGDYAVFGLYRRTSSGPLRFHRLRHLVDNPNFVPVPGDITDLSSLLRILRLTTPDEVYNLAAQSFVPISWTQPLLTTNVTAVGALNMLEATLRIDPHIRFYQASSSEMFGNAPTSRQSETTPFNPQSPYATAKVFAHQITRNYRDHHGLHASAGILFNHESPRRGLEFVTRKVSMAAAERRIAKDLTKAPPSELPLPMGNIDPRRDWGYAGDYVKAMHLMLRQDKPGDYVIATGQSHSVRELLQTAFSYVGLMYTDYVIQDPDLQRSNEVYSLCGDASKAKHILGWEPTMTFTELIHMMVDSDLALLRSQRRT